MAWPLQFVLTGIAVAAPLLADEFQNEIRPVLAEYCQACHAPDSDNRIRFLQAESITDISKDRGL